MAKVIPQGKAFTFGYTINCRQTGEVLWYVLGVNGIVTDYYEADELSKKWLNQYLKLWKTKTSQPTLF